MTAATDRRPVALIGAAVVAVVVVGLVLAVGVARPPALALIDDDPTVAPPAALATHGWDGGRSCVTIVRVDGSIDQPWCSSGGTELLGWDDRGLLLRTYGSGDGLELVVDPGDGEVLASEPTATDRFRSASWGSDVTASRAGGGRQVEVRLDDGTLLWRTDAPDGYEVTRGWRSPDGAAVALVDNAGRLLLAPADGSHPPRIWATDVRHRDDVVWEGGG